MEEVAGLFNDDIGYTEAVVASFRRAMSLIMRTDCHQLRFGLPIRARKLVTL